MTTIEDPEGGCALIGLALIIAGALLYAGSFVAAGWAGIATLLLLTAGAVGVLGIVFRGDR